MTTHRTRRFSSAAQPAVFATTHWSVVLAANHNSNDSTSASSALSKLCRVYWYPLYAYVRRRGYSPEDAQDLTQEFFLRLLQKDWLAQADRERGRFRTFLLAALSHFLANEWHKHRAKKRGGAVELVPLQFDNAETRYSLEPVDPLTPERYYERRWALAVLEEVLNRLVQEAAQEGRSKLLEALKPCLLGDSQSLPYSSLAEKLGMAEGAVKVAVHRLRKRYRECLKQEIANTVSTPQEIEAEMRHLFAALSG